MSSHKVADADEGVSVLGEKFSPRLGGSVRGFARRRATSKVISMIRRGSRESKRLRASQFQWFANVPVGIAEQTGRGGPRRSHEAKSRPRVSCPHTHVDNIWTNGNKSICHFPSFQSASIDSTKALALAVGERRTWRPSLSQRHRR